LIIICPTLEGFVVIISQIMGMLLSETFNYKEIEIPTGYLFEYLGE
jgi:hypothetical protein